MLKTIKYTSNFPVEERCGCSEKLDGCEATAAYHVCFEDGSGKSVCKSCFDQRVNTGAWVTDSTEKLAS